MNKKTTTAILLATSMMLTLMGCGGASGNTSSSSDNASVAEADVDTNNDSSDAAEADENDEESSTESESSSSDSSVSSTDPADGSFEYSGLTLSVLDDLQTTLDKLNSAFPNEAQEINNEKTPTGLHSYGYDYDSSVKSTLIDIITFDNNGTQTVGDIFILKDSFKTPKGISVGNSPDDVVKAYGEPNSKKEHGNGQMVDYYYKFENYNLLFTILDGSVFSISYSHPDSPNQ